MTRFRPLAGLLLALIVAVASLGLAVAHGQPRVAGWMDLCGDGAAVVAVDARGQPVGVTHPCPDCTAPLAFASPPPPMAMPLPPQSHRQAARPAAGLYVARRPAPEPDARGPPVLI